MNKIFYMNVAETLDSAFAFYKKSFWKHVGVTLICSAVAGVIMYLIMIVGTMAGLITMLTTFTSFTSSESSLYWASAAILAAVFSLLEFTSLYSAGSASVTRGLFFGHRGMFGEELGRGLLGLLKASTALLVKALANFAVLLPVFRAIMALLGADGYGGWLTRLLNNIGRSGHSAAGMVTVVQIILLIVIAAWILYMAVGTLFMLTIPVCVFEKKLFVSALIRAVNLVRKDFGRLFFANLVWSGAQYLFIFTMTAAAQLLFYLLAQSSASVLIILSIYLAITLTAAVNYVVIVPLSGIFSATIYFNQRVKYEGADIAERLAAIRAKSWAGVIR